MPVYLQCMINSQPFNSFVAIQSTLFLTNIQDEILARVLFGEIQKKHSGRMNIDDLDKIIY